jgi:hypothetical protein
MCWVAGRLRSSAMTANPSMPCIRASTTTRSGAIALILSRPSAPSPACSTSKPLWLNPSAISSRSIGLSSITMTRGRDRGCAERCCGVDGSVCAVVAGRATDAIPVKTGLPSDAGRSGQAKTARSDAASPSNFHLPVASRPEPSRASGVSVTLCRRPAPKKRPSNEPREPKWMSGSDHGEIRFKAELIIRILMHYYRLCNIEELLALRAFKCSHPIRRRCIARQEMAWPARGGNRAEIAGPCAQTRRGMRGRLVYAVQHAAACLSAGLGPAAVAWPGRVRRPRLAVVRASAAA